MMMKPTMCNLCVHFGFDVNDEGQATCAAYPGKIPNEIRYGHVDHREPAPGDQGILFTPKPDVNPALLERVMAKFDA